MIFNHLFHVDSSAKNAQSEQLRGHSVDSRKHELTLEICHGQESANGPRKAIPLHAHTHTHSTAQVDCKLYEDI